MCQMRKINLKPQSTTSDSIVKAIKANNEETLEHLYNINYPKVELFILKNNGTVDQAKDTFQEAFVAAWKNIKSNKFHPQSETAINGYLYTIAKNKWMDYLRSNLYKKTLSTSTHFQENKDTIETPNDDIFKEQRLTNVMQAFNELGAACKTLLTKFYFEKKSMKQIAKELQLDAASTRNKKYRCMQKLRDKALKIEE